LIVLVGLSLGKIAVGLVIYYKLPEFNPYRQGKLENPVIYHDGLGNYLQPVL
jgi:hypothetical protein